MSRKNRRLDDNFASRSSMLLKGIKINIPKSISDRNKRIHQKRIEQSVNYWYKKDNEDIFDKV